MREIITSWPWYDQLVAILAISAIIATPWVLSKQLTRIIELLTEIRNQGRDR